MYFRPEDYASFWLRALVDIVDAVVFLTICVAVFLLVMISGAEGELAVQLMFAACLTAGFLYFVVLKASGRGTPGYRLFGVRIVALDGKLPGYWPLTVRFLFGWVGPLNWLLDIVWLSSDPNRQALRDKFANTYVVKRKAEVAGEGPVTFRYYSICGTNWLFREVQAQSAGA